MNKTEIPFKVMIFVCTNARGPGARISCAGTNRCGELILNKLKDHVKKHQMEHLVRVAKSGCQEQCEKGPVLSITPHNIMLQAITEHDIDHIISTYLSPSSWR